MEFKTDAEWYCRKDKEREAWFDILFSTMRKYGVKWDRATDDQRAFIVEQARAAYESRED